MSPDIKKILDLEDFSDLEVSTNGVAAKRRPDIAPFAYEIVVNRPASEETLLRLQDYAAGADASMVRDLYCLCNGLRVGATKFAVYGVLTQGGNVSDDIIFGPPLDINIPNIYARPKTFPDGYLIVGSSKEIDPRGKELKALHSITPDATLVVTNEDDHLAVFRRYYSVEEWLVCEVRRAVEDSNRW
jgi:hypothetical protein